MVVVEVSLRVRGKKENSESVCSLMERRMLML
jgi:hypothetical protein